jgi:para-nitrobenzyl esterase
MTNPVARTKAGELRGVIENGVAVFRAVPYAAPPVSELRFAPPQPVPTWQGVRDATREGPIAPQGRSRLAHVMGDFQSPQSEDCLTLNIWTPGTDSAKRPVLVWIHGGAFSSGAGSLAWYAGDRFAANGDVVAVSINYRLGALGFLCLPGVSSGNLGLLDQIAALRFVRDNIAAFGGDPDNVTVVGQSAGAASIAIMMTMRPADGLFRRAILQSAPFGRISRNLDDAHRIGRRYVEVLGLKLEEAARLKSVPIPDLIAAQG